MKARGARSTHRRQLAAYAAVAAGGDRKIKTEEAGSRANLPRHAALCARRSPAGAGGCCYRARA